MSHGNFLRAIKEWGVKGTWRKLYKMRTLKFGTLMGVDKYGNEYYENRIDYPYGQHRWCEYAGDKSFYEYDPAVVPAEWHIWLHGVTDTLPTSRTTGSTYKETPLAISSGSSNPYKRNLGGVIQAHTPNLSQLRPRGYGLGNGISGGSKPNEELYYTQPGWPLDSRNKTRASTRKSRVNFSLSDTVETLKAKAAVRAGVSVAEYDNYTGADSSTRLALVASNSPGVSSDEATEKLSYEGAAEALVGVPEAPARRELAVRLASSTGHARSWGKDVEAGSFAAAISEVLSPQEEDFWSAGYEEDELLVQIAQFEKYVDHYSAVPNKAAAAGVEAAKEKRDEAIAKLVQLRSIRAKLEALSTKFDERANEAAKAAQKAANSKPLA